MTSQPLAPARASHRTLIDVSGHDGFETGVIVGASVSHRDADVDILARASVAHPRSELERLCSVPDVSEAFVVQTCNRVERYVVVPTPRIGREVLAGEMEDSVCETTRWLDHDAAIEHLHRVGAGLESMALGEDQILGQLRAACAEAEAAGAVGPLLEDVVWKAIHVGERVRTETAINEGQSSLTRAAVAYARERGALDHAAVLLVGAGATADRIATALEDIEGIELRIANRTHGRAEALATRLSIPTRIVDLSALPTHLPSVDTVFAATASPTPIVGKGTLADGGPLFVVDMGQPRDVDPRAGEIPDVTLADLDDIAAVVEETTSRRTRAATEAEEIVQDELRQLHLQLKRRQAEEVIAAMYRGAEAAKRRELQVARRRLAGSDSPEAVLADFADALVGQLMAAPTKSLQEAAEADDWETIQLALRLFDPEFPSGSVEAEVSDPSESSAVDEGV